jgi:hypothetical protein
MKLIDVEVQDIKFASALSDAIEHKHVVRNDVPNIAFEPKRSRNAGDQLSCGNRITAGEQRHVVTQTYQFLA